MHTQCNKVNGDLHEFFILCVYFHYKVFSYSKVTKNGHILNKEVKYQSFCVKPVNFIKAEDKMLRPLNDIYRLLVIYTNKTFVIQKYVFK